MAIGDAGQVHAGTVPWHRDDLEPVCIGGMGSAFLRWQFAPAEVAEVFGHDWSLLGRRVFVDPERGEVSPDGTVWTTRNHLAVGRGNWYSAPRS